MSVEMMAHPRLQTRRRKRTEEDGVGVLVQSLGCVTSCVGRSDRQADVPTTRTPQEERYRGGEGACVYCPTVAAMISLKRQNQAEWFSGRSSFRSPIERDGEELVELDESVALVGWSS